MTAVGAVVEGELQEDGTGVLPGPGDVLTASCWDSPRALLGYWSQPSGVQGTCKANSF